MSSSGTESEAQYYISTPPCQPGPGLRKLLDSVGPLPCWVPHRSIADALGKSHGAVEAAEAACGGRGYRWASEFENLHMLWPFEELGFVAHGVRFAGSEQFYQLHKHPDARLWPAETTPSFEEAISRVANGSAEEAYRWGWFLSRRCLMRDDWETAKVGVMREAVSHKFRADPGLRALLISTSPHPLASVKGDPVWGIGLNGKGENLLAVLLMELRDTLIAEQPADEEGSKSEDHEDGEKRSPVAKRQKPSHEEA